MNTPQATLRARIVIAPSHLLQRQDASAQVGLFGTLKRRYRWASHRDDLRDEIDWLSEVRPLLAEAAAKERPMTRWRLNLILEDLFDPLVRKGEMKAGPEAIVDLEGKIDHKD